MPNPRSIPQLERKINLTPKDIARLHENDNDILIQNSD